MAFRVTPLFPEGFRCGRLAYLAGRCGIRSRDLLFPGETRRWEAIRFDDSAKPDRHINPAVPRLERMAVELDRPDRSDRAPFGLPGSTAPRRHLDAWLRSGDASTAMRSGVHESAFDIRVTDRKDTTMTTADSVRERALFLAVSGADQVEAVQELEATCEGRRVAVVRARQMMAKSLQDEPNQPATTRAIEFLDDLLARLPA